MALVAAAASFPGAADATAQTTAQTPAVLELVTVLGCTDCNGPQLFGAIQHIALDPGRGRVAIADDAAPRIRLFSLDGSFIGSAAAEGDGPGEARSVHGIWFTGAGGLLFVDTRRQQLTELDAERRFVATTRLPGFPVAMAYERSRDAVVMGVMDFLRNTVSIQRWQRGSASFTTLRESISPPVADAEGGPPLFVTFASRPSGGFVAGEGTVYRVWSFTATGEDGAVTWSRDVQRSRRTPREIAAERDRQEAAFQRLSRRGANPEGAPRPEIDPLRRHFYGDAFAFDDKDRLWVRAGRSAGTERSVFDVFDPAGAYLGEVAVPVRLAQEGRTFVIQGDLLAVVVLDELDVPTVSVWRIRTP
ncbi:MAG TPA: hypothetical protein VMM79_02365 [Longimicrobiales bacterium]|nr:hypothetical protein [Longimicrobiales bacterium]